VSRLVTVLRPAPSIISPRAPYCLDSRHCTGDAKDSGEQKVALRQRKNTSRQSASSDSPNSSRSPGSGAFISDAFWIALPARSLARHAGTYSISTTRRSHDSTPAVTCCIYGAHVMASACLSRLLRALPAELGRAAAGRQRLDSRNQARWLSWQVPQAALYSPAAIRNVIRAELPRQSSWSTGY
jgi:hypothetical protein